MEFLAGVLEFFQTHSAVPRPYGAFHLLFFAGSVALGALLAAKLKNPSERTVRKLLLAVGITVLLLEIYKQIALSFFVTAEGIVFRYDWRIFPWQFCSTPMYVYLLGALLKKGMHSRACSYLAGYSTFAGLVVMISPYDVFVNVAGINLQTMVCHGAMLTVGIFLLFSGYIKTDLRSFLRGVPIFAAALATAIILNEVSFYSGILEQGHFNMFFLNPHCAPEMPVLSWFQRNFPSPVPQLAYLFIFSAIALGIFLLASVAKKLLGRRAEKTE